MEAPVARLYRNFRSSFRDLFASGPSSSEKHLENFSKILSLRCLATCPGNLFATWFNCEKRVFCASRTVFKTFQFFAWKFFTVNYLVHSSLSQTHCVSLTKTSIVLHHLNFNLQENVWVFLFSLNISCLLPWFLGLLSYFLVLRYMMFKYGLGSLCWVDWMGCLDYDYMMLVSNAFMVDFCFWVVYHACTVMCISCF